MKVHCRVCRGRARVLAFRVVRNAHAHGAPPEASPLQSPCYHLYWPKEG